MKRVDTLQIVYLFRYATSRHQRSNSGVSSGNVKSGSSYTNSLPRHVSLYNNNNDNGERVKKKAKDTLHMLKLE